jgi:hypothetical protein
MIIAGDGCGQADRRRRGRNTIGHVAVQSAKSTAWTWGVQVVQSQPSMRENIMDRTLFKSSMAFCTSWSACPLMPCLVAWTKCLHVDAFVLQSPQRM